MRHMKFQGGFAEKQVVRILTVDMAKRRVECALRDGGLVYAAVWEVPSVFRLPKQGEVWTIRRDSGIWRLDSLMENRDISETSTNLADMDEGQARILTEPSEEGSGFIINKFHATRQISALIGNDEDLVYEVEHGLGTTRVKHEITEVDSGTVVVADFTVLDENTVSIEFGIPATEDQYRVVLTG